MKEWWVDGGCTEPLLILRWFLLTDLLKIPGIVRPGVSSPPVLVSVEVPSVGTMQQGTFIPLVSPSSTTFGSFVTAFAPISATISSTTSSFSSTTIPLVTTSTIIFVIATTTTASPTISVIGTTTIIPVVTTLTMTATISIIITTTTIPIVTTTISTTPTETITTHSSSEKTFIEWMFSSSTFHPPIIVAPSLFKAFFVTLILSLHHLIFLIVGSCIKLQLLVEAPRLGGVVETVVGGVLEIENLLRVKAILPRIARHYWSHQ